MEWRLFPEGTIPEWTTPQWYEGRETAPHLEQSGHKERIMSTAHKIWSLNPNKVVDLGAGDGGLLSLLKNYGIEAHGYDLQQTNVEVATERRKVDVIYADVVSNFYSLPHDADLAVATEFLEHLIDPHLFVEQLSEFYPTIVVSSPWHETGEDHYEYHTWAWDEDGYRELVEQGGYTVIDHQKVEGAQIIVGSL